MNDKKITKCFNIFPLKITLNEKSIVNNSISNDIRNKTLDPR